VALKVTIKGGGGGIEFDTAEQSMQMTRRRLQRMRPEQLGELIALLAKAKEGGQGEGITGAWNDFADELLTSAREKLAASGEEQTKKEAEQSRAELVPAAYQAVRAAATAGMGQPRTGTRVQPIGQPRTGRPAVQARLTPKDTSARPRTMFMAYVSDDEIGAANSRRLIADVASFGATLGFVVRVSCLAGARPFWTCGPPAGVTLAELDEGLDLSGWAEDSGEFRTDGRVAIPALVKGDAKQVIEDDRAARGYKALADRTTEAYLNMARVGVSVQQHKKWAEKVALGGVLNQEVFNLGSHLEGGNLLIGSYPNGTPFALVGRDGFAVTRTLYKSDAAALAAIADDVGAKPEQVFVIEQPGQYHLDMGMLIIGSGIVAVNDSGMVLDVLDRQLKLVCGQLIELAKAGGTGYTAAQVTLAYDDTIAKLRTTLGQSVDYEARAVQGLRAARPELTIQRVPAVFPPTEFTPRMNFLNGEIGSTEAGLGYLITNGGLPFAEEAVLTRYAAGSGGLLGTVCFTTPAAASASFDQGGGIGCRVKSSLAVYT